MLHTEVRMTRAPIEVCMYESVRLPSNAETDASLTPVRLMKYPKAIALIVSEVGLSPLK